MSITINGSKDLAIAPRPVVLCRFKFADASYLYCATHDGTTATGTPYGGNDYLPLVADHTIGPKQHLNELGIDRIPNASVKLADPAGTYYQTYERGAGKGFKGAELLMRFVLFDVEAGEYTTDYDIPFVGYCDQAGHDGTHLTITANAIPNLGRYKLPPTPLSYNCPLLNPVTEAERADAASATSKFYPCGETRDTTTAPPCDYTKATCTQPARFLGCTYSVKNTAEGVSYLEGKKQWRNADTSAKYRDFWPLWLGGKCWLNNARAINIVGDGNYTRGEVAVGWGEVAVERVLLNGEELSYGGTDYHWSYVNHGQRDGTPCADVPYNSGGDPYGNCTAILVRCPNSVWAADSEPSIQILGSKPSIRAAVAIASAEAAGGVITVHFDRAMSTYDPGDGNTVTIEGCGFAAANGTWTLRYSYVGDYTKATLEGSSATGSGTGGTLWWDSSSMSASGAAPTPWLIREALKWCDYSDNKIDATTFTDVAEVCLANGYCSAMVLRDQRSAADLVRGLRQSIGAILYITEEGKIGLKIEGPLAEQQPAPVSGSNFDTPIVSQKRDGTPTNGYAAYQFTYSNSWDVQRTPQRVAEMPNRVSFPFQDPEQGYAVSNFTLIESDDVTRLGQEVPGGLQVQPEGIASIGFARACANLGLKKIHRGNSAGDTRGTDWWRWTSSFRGCRVQPGQLVLLNFADLALSNQLVRVAKVSPSRNYETVTFEGHFHSDAWYLSAGAVPTPGSGTITNGDLKPGDVQSIAVVATDGPVSVRYDLTYNPPATLGTFAGVSLQAEIPKDSGNIGSTVDADYNGDPDGVGTARYGTVSIVVPKAIAEQDITLWVASRTATYRNALTTSTPHSHQTMTAATTGGDGTPAPTAPASVTGSETGSRVNAGLGRVQLTWRTTWAHPGGTEATLAWYQLVVPSGTEGASGYATVLTSGTDRYCDFPAWAPTANQNWSVKIRLVGENGAMSDEVTSGTVAISAIADPAATIVTGATVGSIVDSESGGVHQWTVNVSLTVAADASNWITKLYRVVGDVSGSVFTPLAGGLEDPLHDDPGIQQFTGAGTFSLAFGPHNYEGHSSAHIVRFYLASRSRKGGDGDQSGWILQTNAFGAGVDHYDVDVTPPATGTVDLTRTIGSSIGRGMYRDASGRPSAGAGDSLLANWSFEDGAEPWQSNVGVEIVSACADGTAPWTGTKCAKWSTPRNLYQGDLPCRPGDQFHLEVGLRADAGTTGALYYAIRFLKSDGSVSSTTGTNASVTTTWTAFTISATAPADAAYVQVHAGNANPLTAGAFYCDCVKLVGVRSARQIQLGTTLDSDASGNAIVKLGTLTQPHIVPGALSDPNGGAWGASGAPVYVYAGLPSYASYNLGVFLFNTVTGHTYKRGASGWVDSGTPGDLVAGTIAAGVVYSGSVTASQVTAGTFTGFSFVGCTMELTSGTQLVKINSTDGIFYEDTGNGSVGDGVRVVIKRGWNGTSYNAMVVSDPAATGHLTSIVPSGMSFSYSATASHLSIGSTGMTVTDPVSGSQVVITASGITINGRSL